jgi:hypothetical protein
MKKFLLSSLGSFAGTFVALGMVVLLAGVASAVWQGPSEGAPGGNVLYPINEGTVGQTKNSYFASTDYIAANEFCLAQDTCIENWAEAGLSLSSVSFITPVQFYSADGPTSWQTFDASSYIPANANGVIVQGHYSLNGPDGGNPSFVYIGSSDSSYYKLMMGKCDGSEDGCGGAAQGFFPVSTSRVIYYQIDYPGFNQGVTLELVGYF